MIHEVEGDILLSSAHAIAHGVAPNDDFRSGLAHALRYTPFNFLPVLVGDAFQAGPVTLMRAGLEVLAADISDELEHIQAPVLIVWGEKDTLLPLQLGRLLHRRLPASELVIIPGAGHNPMWDKPREFNQIVLDFLEGRGISASGA